MIKIELTLEQARELRDLLWECCCETIDGVKYLRTNLPLSDTWEIVTDAILSHDPSPYCSACGAKRAKDCHCGEIADNE